MMPRSSPNAVRPRGDIDVSVVVCTYNRVRDLARALDSLWHQEVPGDWNWEIVVVDNAGTDGTADFLEQLKPPASIPMRCVREDVPGVAAARNRGIREARGEWIAFFDDDQVADPRWLRELLLLARSRSLRVVGGAVRVAIPGNPNDWPAACRRIFGETSAHGPARPYRRREAPGTGNLLVHRSVFEEVGAFDATLREAGEDTDLYRRIRAAGIAAWFQPAAVIEHRVDPERLTDAALRAACRRIGWGFCRRDLREHGRVGIGVRAAARLLKMLLITMPRYLLGRMRPSPRLLEHRIDLWRNAAYLRAACTWMCPSFAAVRQRAQPPDFREESGRAVVEHSACRDVAGNAVRASVVSGKEAP